MEKFWIHVIAPLLILAGFIALLSLGSHLTGS